MVLREKRFSSGNEVNSNTRRKREFQRAFVGSPPSSNQHNRDLLPDTKEIAKLKTTGRCGHPMHKQHAYVIYSVLKFVTIELIKFSRMITARIDFQSEAFSPSSKQIDSRANLTIAGGLAIERTSTRCCFLIDLTAINRLYRIGGWLITTSHRCLVIDYYHSSIQESDYCQLNMYRSE